MFGTWRRRSEQRDPGAETASAGTAGVPACRLDLSNAMGNLQAGTPAVPALAVPAAAHRSRSQFNLTITTSR